MKQTKQKKLIFEQLQNREDHPTAETIYQELHDENPRLSLATVYRNLNQFAEAGKIRKIEVPNKKDRFDPSMVQHDHAICSHCGKVIDVFEKSMKRPKRSLIDGFEVDDVSILYFGKCTNCQKSA